MRLLPVALATVLLLASQARAADAPRADVHAVLAKPRQGVQTADFRANGHLVRVDAAGARTSYPMTLKGRWFPGVLRLLLQIDAPGAARIHVLLEMRPDGGNSIRIAHPGDKTPAVLPFARWSEGPVASLGAGFSFEDFLESQYFWAAQTALGRVKYGARDCDLLKSTPGSSDRTHYAEVKTWLDHSIGYPVYVEKTIKATGTVKEFTYFGLRQNGGVWSASQVEGKIRGQVGSTLLIIDRGSTKANLDLREFSPEQLTRF